MQPSATEFSVYGDQVFDRFAAQFSNAQRWRLMLEQPLGAEDFARIRAALLGYLGVVLEARGPLTEAQALQQLLACRGTLKNYTQGRMLAPTREHTLEFNLLHQSVVQALSRFALSDHIDGIDLPINVRLVYGAADTSRTAAPFSSTKLHSDVWAGVPPDAVVVVLPVLGDIDTITIECCEMRAEQELGVMRTYDAYEEASPQIEATRWYSDAAMKHGHLYLADVRLLHRTVRRRPEGVRLSIDFRLRHNDAAYRAMVPAVQGGGPDSVDTRVPFSLWQAVGRQCVMVFDRSLHDRDAGMASSSPVNQASYRLLPLW